MAIHQNQVGHARNQALPLLECSQNVKLSQ